MKKFLTMLLCMVLIIGSLSACKKSDDAKDNTDDSTDITTTEVKEIDYSEPVNFSYWLYSSPNDYYSSYNDNPVVKYLEKKFNMTLDCQQPAVGTEADSLSLMFGTGELTDMLDVTQYTGSISQLYDDGIIVNIADYLDYMPNFSKLLEDENYRKSAYSDDGKILTLGALNKVDGLMWGGIVYRRDILDTMTGGNVVFPSGNAEPTTIEDWDYMLPLMKQYFDAAKMADSAVLILPSSGFFATNDLISSFGTSISYYNANGTVKYGPTDDAFYSYLKKMNEWYQAGYIYKDFATRTTDPFYLPNTALTYGGAAGVWFGLNSQLGTALSMPNYGLNVDVRALKNPLDTASGITTAANSMHNKFYESPTKLVISKSCKNVERLLATIDTLYSDEGGMLRTYGLDKEHGSAEDELYVKYGLTDGTYSIAADGTFSYNALLSFGGGAIADGGAFGGNRLPGIGYNVYEVENNSDVNKEASAIWYAYDKDSTTLLPGSLCRTTDEDATYTSNQSNIDSYVGEMVVKYILGTEELNDTTWAAFKDQLDSYGLGDNLAIQQAAYDRYLVR
ncbi:type 2 periplasmic-binding domain-containing protein [Anaerobium acetethylicum]|uniref:Extracellular solute-binding protein n=1 Tax=Anaerobium acetethylicum TaxID=1619234 RepID=A0A1D3TX03_9FIRM|nr:extracellular solute-binding protein [Anaerobium acetethylicum]SCP98842.1 extracellular solute-binding protein [Anaerobium acetethylicum]